MFYYNNYNNNYNYNYNYNNNNYYYYYYSYCYYPPQNPKTSQPPKTAKTK